MKISKFADSSVVCNRNFGEILPFSGWAQVRYQQPKMAKNLPCLWCHSQKNETQNQTKFSPCRRKDLQSLLKVWTTL